MAEPDVGKGIVKSLQGTIPLVNSMDGYRLGSGSKASGTIWAWVGRLTPKALDLCLRQFMSLLSIRQRQSTPSVL